MWIHSRPVGQETHPHRAAPGLHRALAAKIVRMGFQRRSLQVHGHERGDRSLGAQPGIVILKHHSGP